MSSEPRSDLARRVITGVDAQGRSTIVSDSPTPTWVRRPTGLVVMEVWRADSLPTEVGDCPPESTGVIAPPTPGGVCVRTAVFPPDTEIDEESAAAYEAAMHDLYGDQGEPVSAEVAGMHRTDSIDITTVVEGEIWLVLEQGETLLRAGDSLVQRGTRHAWRNRGDRPCTITSTVVTAVRT